MYIDRIEAPPSPKPLFKVITLDTKSLLHESVIKLFFTIGKMGKVSLQEVRTDGWKKSLKGGGSRAKQSYVIKSPPKPV